MESDSDESILPEQRILPKIKSNLRDYVAPPLTERPDKSSFAKRIWSQPDTPKSRKKPVPGPLPRPVIPGIYQENNRLDDPRSVVRTAGEAYMYHAVTTGGLPLLFHALTRLWKHWFNKAFYFPAALDHTRKLIDKDILYAYLVQHPPEVWAAIITGTLARFEMEGSLNNYVKLKMPLNMSAGAYLSSMACTRKMERGQLTERSGRGFTVNEWDNILYHADLYYDPDEKYTWKQRKQFCYEVDNFHRRQGKKKKYPIPRFQSKGNLGQEFLASRPKSGKRMHTVFGTIYGDASDRNVPFYRSPSEVGMTGGPLMKRAAAHPFNDSTTHLMGMLNVIIAHLYPERYHVLKIFALFQQWDPDYELQQAVMEGAGSAAAQSLLPGGGGLNEKSCTTGTRGHHAAVYKVAEDNLFNYDMIERWNDQVKMLADAMDARDQYKPGDARLRLMEMDLAQRDMVKQRKTNEMLREAYKRARRESDARLVKSMRDTEGMESMAPAFQGLCTLLLATERDFAHEDLVHECETAVEAVSRVMPKMYTEEEYAADKESLPHILKFVHERDPELPEGWTYEPVGTKGQSIFTETATGRTTMLPPRVYLSDMDQYKSVAESVLFGDIITSAETADEPEADEPFVPASIPRISMATEFDVVDVDVSRWDGDSSDDELDDGEEEDEEDEDLQRLMAVYNEMGDRLGMPRVVYDENTDWEEISTEVEQSIEFLKSLLPAHERSSGGTVEEDEEVAPTPKKAFPTKASTKAAPAATKTKTKTASAAPTASTPIILPYPAAPTEDDEAIARRLQQTEYDLEDDAMDTALQKPVKTRLETEFEEISARLARVEVPADAAEEVEHHMYVLKRIVDEGGKASHFEQIKTELDAAISSCKPKSARREVPDSQDDAMSLDAASDSDKPTSVDSSKSGSAMSVDSSKPGSAMAVDEPEESDMSDTIVLAWPSKPLSIPPSGESFEDALEELEERVVGIKKRLSRKLSVRARTLGRIKLGEALVFLGRIVDGKEDVSEWDEHVAKIDEVEEECCV